MTRPISAFLFLVAYPAALAGQARASLGVGVGTVRGTGGTAFSSAAIAPALVYGSRNLAASFMGSIASLPQGVWSSQGRIDVWGATRFVAARLRFGGEGIAAGTTRTDGGGTRAVHGVAEALWWAPQWGVGLGAGPSAGWVGSSQVSALHTRARAWWRPAPGTDWQASVEPTRFLGAWFTDASAGVALARGSLEASFWATARLSHVYVSKGAASAQLRWFASPTVSLEVGGGGYLPDPYQDLPRAGYFTAGVRLHQRPRDPPRPSRSGWPALVPERRGDSLVVRFRFEGAHTVAIAGDWNAWQPLPLRPLGSDQWEAALALRPGLYHFNLLVDGTDWVVPSGVATLKDELGGLVGILLVP